MEVFIRLNFFFLFSQMLFSSIDGLAKVKLFSLGVLLVWLGHNIKSIAFTSCLEKGPFVFHDLIPETVVRSEVIFEIAHDAAI